MVHLITELSTGGAQSVLASLAPGLQAVGYRQHVVCLYTGNTPIAAELRRNGIRVTDLHMRRKWPLGAIWRLYRLLRVERPQIVHGWLFHANMLARIVGKSAGVPVVLTSRHSTEIGGQRREELLAWTSSMGDGVIAVSDAVRNAEIHKARANPAHVHTIHNFVDTAQFADPDGTRRGTNRQRLGIDCETFVIGTVGRLQVAKGLDVLLNSFASVRQRHPNSRLLLIGDGPVRSQLEGQAAQLQIDDAVTFLGDRDDVPELLHTMDIFVLASRWEGFGIVLAEAMAAGVAVVATAVGGIPEVVKDGESGLLVPPDNVPALASAICRLMDDNDLRTRLAGAGALRVRSKFSLERAVAEYDSLYRGYLAAKGLLPVPAVGAQDYA